MEEKKAVKELSSVVPNPGSSGRLKQRYPLRSATKSKEENSPLAELSNSSAPTRGNPASTVSKSVGVLDLSGKDKSAKPPRRLSVPAKSTASPVPKTSGNITPISETMTRRSPNNQGKSETFVSNVSGSARKKFSVLTSASYWLSQIKLSESGAKHSISLGFFKLALEAGCEPLQRMRDELKAYAHRHNLVELGESVKELFESYNMSVILEQLQQVSESCSLIPEEGTRSSDEDVHSSSSSVGTRKLKPKSSNTDVAQLSSTTDSAKKKATQKTNPATRIRKSVNKNSANLKSVSETGARKLPNKSQKPSKPESNKGKDNVKRQGKKSVSEEGIVSPLPTEDNREENKENMV